MSAQDISIQQPPLQLESSFFQRLEINAEKSPAPEGSGGEYRFGFTADLSVNNQDPLQYRVDIGVNGAAVDDGWAPYRFQVDIFGIFRLPEEREDKEKLLLLTGAAMLYGAAREMLTIVTGRLPWGAFVLPTVSPDIFLQVARQRSKPNPPTTQPER